jgi:hypothetical protein
MILNKKLIGLLLFICINLPIKAQLFFSKPYLKITNTLSGQVYKIKPNTKIEFLLNDDSVLTKNRIEYFSDSTHIVLKNGLQISLDQISYIRFRPKSKGLRITKLLYYMVWTGTFTIVIYENTNPSNDPYFEAIPFFPFFIIGTVTAVGIAEIGEYVFNTLITKRELFKSKNLKMEIIKK